MRLIPDSTTINFADSNMSVSSDIGVLHILECFDRKQLKFFKNNRVLSQPNHFPAHRVVLANFMSDRYLYSGRFLYQISRFSGRYLNSSRFSNSGLKSRLLPTATKDMHMKFETEIPKQTWVTLPKPCHPETEKSNMATRQPFRKWGHWKSIGSYPYT